VGGAARGGCARDIDHFVQSCYEPLTSLTMDDVLRRSSPEAVSQELKRVDNLAVPLWRYDLGKIPVVNQSVINEFYHYGVADADATVLKESRYDAGVPKGDAKPSMVVDARCAPHSALQGETGIPLFALAEIDA